MLGCAMFEVEMFRLVHNIPILGCVPFNVIMLLLHYTLSIFERGDDKATDEKATK